MKILDCNTTLECLADIKDIVSYLNEYNISAAGVRNDLSETYHPIEGNKELAEQCKPYENIIPIYTGITTSGGDFPKEEGFVKKVVNEQGLGIYFAPYGESPLNNSMCKWSMGEYYKFLSQYNLPLFIKSEDISLNTIYEIQKEYELKIVLMDIHYGLAGDLYSLLDVTENFYVETSGLKGFEMLQDMCKKFGANRLVFGSRFPVFEPGTSLADLFYADISKEEKQIIACNPIFGDLL